MKTIFLSIHPPSPNMSKCSSSSMTRSLGIPPDRLVALVIFFSPYNPPASPIPTNPPRVPPQRVWKNGPFRVRFSPFRVRFGPILASLGVLGGVRVWSGRGGSVRKKIITGLATSHFSLRPVLAWLDVLCLYVSLPYGKPPSEGCPCMAPWVVNGNLLTCDAEFPSMTCCALGSRPQADTHMRAYQNGGGGVCRKWGPKRGRRTLNGNDKLFLVRTWTAMGHQPFQTLSCFLLVCSFSQELEVLHSNHRFTDAVGVARYNLSTWKLLGGFLGKSLSEHNFWLRKSRFVLPQPLWPKRVKRLEKFSFTTALPKPIKQENTEITATVTVFAVTHYHFRALPHQDSFPWEFVAVMWCAYKVALLRQ